MNSKKFLIYLQTDNSFKILSLRCDTSKIEGTKQTIYFILPFFILIFLFCFNCFSFVDESYFDFNSDKCNFFFYFQACTDLKKNHPVQKEIIIRTKRPITARVPNRGAFLIKNLSLNSTPYADVINDLINRISPDLRLTKEQIVIFSSATSMRC